jgi:hypothetical protein
MPWETLDEMVKQAFEEGLPPGPTQAEIEQFYALQVIVETCSMRRDSNNST